VREVAFDLEDRSTPHADSALGGHPRQDPPSAEARIRVVSSPVQRALMIGAPVAATIVLLALARDPMFASGLVAVIAVFLVFHVFASRIPDAFDRVRARRVIDDGQLATFPEFRRVTEAALNSRVALAVAVVFALLGLARFPVQAGGLSPFLDQLSANLRAGQPLILLDAIAEVALGFVLGLIAWRMFVVAVRLIRLGQQYELRLQIGHPDGCAGLRPIGDLCLWNALLLAVPAIFLGFWVPLASRFGYGTTYTDLHLAMLGALVCLAVVTFIAPLWAIHLAMRRDAERIRGELDDIGRTIDRLSRDLLRRADELPPDETKRIMSDLQAHQDVYRRHEQIPTWPIDLRIALKFGAAQVVPVLGLTGISKPIADLAGSLVRALEGGGL
jgi:hypothetical protein